MDALDGLDDADLEDLSVEEVLELLQACADNSEYAQSIIADPADVHPDEF